MFRAHVDPDLIPRWMNILPGWTMPVAECDPRPGGRFRFRWSDDQGNGFRIEGDYLEVEDGRRILHLERMFLPEVTPDNRVETLFTARDGGTDLVVTMTLPDAADPAHHASDRHDRRDGEDLRPARRDPCLKAS